MLKKLNMIFAAAMVAMFSVGALAQERKSNPDVPSHHATPIKNIEKVVGIWEASGIYKDGRDISNTDTVGLNTTFEFTRENKYISYSNNERIDSGAFKLNENHSLLYLESAAGHEVSEYKVSFSNDQMTLQPSSESADANAQKFRYVYQRKR